MKRVILTSSSGVGLTCADRADMVVPLIFRFVSGPLPTSHHLEQYLTGGSFRGSFMGDREVRWSDLVARSPQSGLAHKELGLVWFCKAYGVEIIELWFDPSPSNQLQLVWILDYLRSEPYAAERLKLRIVDFDLLGADSTRLRDHAIRQLEVTEPDFEDARAAWEAYRAPTPELCFGLLNREFPTLPFLKPAMEELLAELPSPITGLGATDSATSRSCCEGPQSHQGAVSTGRGARHACVRPMGARSVARRACLRSYASDHGSRSETHDACAARCARAQCCLSPEPAVVDGVWSRGPGRPGGFSPSQSDQALVGAARC